MGNPSKHRQKKRRKKRRVCTMHSGSGLVHTLPKMDHLRPSIALLLQLGVLESSFLFKTPQLRVHPYTQCFFLSEGGRIYFRGIRSCLVFYHTNWFPRWGQSYRCKHNLWQGSCYGIHLFISNLHTNDLEKAHSKHIEISVENIWFHHFQQDKTQSLLKISLWAS